MKEYTEYYKCDLCETVWAHIWDDDDFNNDFTQCPQCNEFDFEEITFDQFSREKANND